MQHENLASCIKACYDCATECNQCFASCLKEQDVKMLARCIALDIDCAQACAMAAAAVSRGSENAKLFCTLCAEICDRCAQECELHKQMEHCAKCAEACRRCAQECRRMSGAS